MIKRVRIKAGEGRILGHTLTTAVKWPDLTVSVAADSNPHICINRHANPVLIEGDMSPDQCRRLIKLPPSMCRDHYMCDCVACA